MRSVCFFTDPDVRAQRSELRRLNTEVQTLANSWTIDVVRGAMIKDPRKAEPHLFVLEQNGITQFTVSDSSHAAHVVSSTMFSQRSGASCCFR